jgi:MFS family permease
MIVAVAVVPAFTTWAKEFNVPIADASYLGSTQVRKLSLLLTMPKALIHYSGTQLISLAIGPLVWIPIADRFGRRPILLLSAAGCSLMNVGCALSRTYGALMVFRILAVSYIFHPRRGIRGAEHSCQFVLGSLSSSLLEWDWVKWLW